MDNIIRKTIYLTLVMLFVVGCSNHWRKADVDSAQMWDDLNNIRQNVESLAAGNQGATTFFALMDDPNAAIYYASAPSGLGPVISVMSFSDFSFLGSDIAPLGYGDIAEARVAFIENGSQCALMVDMVLIDTTAKTRFYNCDTVPVVEDGMFSVQASSADGQLVLYSTDVDKDGELNGVIQLKVDQIGLGNIGKFSTLVGFGP